jgi:DNA-directed RNA polymerase specialized sigma24 family protein
MTTIFIVLYICFLLFPVGREPEKVLLPLFAGDCLLPLSKASERAHFRKYVFLVRKARLRFSVAKLRNFAQIIPATKSVPGTLQEGGASFQTTHWTLVLRAAQNEPTESARQALSAFCEAYWPPLYAFLRHRRYSPTDAQDLVQAFFARLLAQNTLSHADQAKGRLRTFLLGSLQNFLINEHDRARALKRGGKYEILSFDQHLPEAEAAMSGTVHLNDVSCYDLTWAANVVRRSWQNLREAFAAEGKVKLLEELKPFVAGGTTPPNQEDVAVRLGVPIATLRTWISRLRQQYRDSLRAEVARTVSEPVDVDEELRYLYQILMS